MIPAVASRGALTLIAVSAGCLLGCADETPAARKTLHVSCAGSLEVVVGRLARDFERDHPEVAIRVNAGSSSLLARQIREGAPVDLFLSADPRIVEELAAEGRIDRASVVPIARNRVVVIAPSDRARSISRGSDLLDPSIERIALPDSVVPIGFYARSYLRRSGLLDRIEDRIVRTEDVRASLASAAAGAVDLAFVYATDALREQRVRVVWEPPRDSIPPVVLAAGSVRSSQASELAREFLAFLRSARGADAFTRAGFGVPGDAGR